MSGAKKTIKEALLQYDPRCYYCGAFLNKDTATLDHFIPKSKGGKDEFGNAVLACSSCNSKKADNLPEKKYINRGLWLL